MASLPETLHTVQWGWENLLDSKFGATIVSILTGQSRDETICFSGKRSGKNGRLLHPASRRCLEGAISARNGRPGVAVPLGVESRQFVLEKI
jgi:hypothetical protein